MSKNLTVVTDEKGRSIIRDPRHANAGEILSQADWTWLKTSLFLRSKPIPAGRDTSSEAQAPHENTATLIVFNGYEPLRRRLKAAMLDCALAKHGWPQLAIDPIGFFVLALEELYVEQDNTVWNLSDIFGRTEKVRDSWLPQYFILNLTLLIGNTSHGSISQSKRRPSARPRRQR